MFKPPYVVLDVETSENGRGSTEFYRPNFRVDSMAVSWYEGDVIKSSFIEGEPLIGDCLKELALRKIPIVAHNAQFEMGVFKCRFPDYKPIWHADTMRLVQVYDNGGDKGAFEVLKTFDDQLDAIEGADDDAKEKKTYLAGLGLVKACYRILNLPDHKTEAHTWIRENVPEWKKGKKEGGFLNFLPKDLLERYNVADTERTLLLYKHITDYFTKINYDWRKDHRLYFSSMHQVVDAKIRGVPIDRTNLETYRQSVEFEISEIGRSFTSDLSNPIAAVERGRLVKRIGKLKTFRGRKRYVARVKRDGGLYDKDLRFNIGSNKQLAALFIDQLGMEAKFKTAKGAPSFRSAVLGSWGEPGERLKTRRKRLLVLKQTEALLELSAFDGRWHVDLKMAATSTGRAAGGSH
jgi:hypothetical protein